MQLDSARELQQKVLAMIAKRPECRRTLQAAAAPAAYAADEELTGSPQLAVGITRGPKGGYMLAIRLKKKALKGIAEVISAQASGEADVRFIGRVRALMSWHRSRHRPLQIGTSIAHYLNTAGSIGGWVRKAGDKNYLGILSNSHVLVRDNTVIGQDQHTIQPGRVDGGKHPHDRVGTLDAWIPINFSGVNDKDCAVARLDPDEKAKHEACDRAAINGIGQVRGIRDNIEDLLDVPNSVMKVGRSSGKTVGTISSLTVKPLAVEFQASTTREATFTGVIEIQGRDGQEFSQGGDSGSLVCDRDGMAIGLVFAGSQTGSSAGRAVTFVLPIRPALAALGVELITTSG